MLGNVRDTHAKNKGEPMTALEQYQIYVIIPDTLRVIITQRNMWHLQAYARGEWQASGVYTSQACRRYLSRILTFDQLNVFESQLPGRIRSRGKRAHKRVLKGGLTIEDRKRVAAFHKRTSGRYQPRTKKP